MTEPKVVAQAREVTTSVARAVVKQVRRPDRFESLPEPVKAELRTAIRRFASIRNPKDLLRAVEAEAGRLSQVVVPALVTRPLPVQGVMAATAVAAGSAAMAAAFAEIDALAVIVTDGVAAPSAAAAGAGLLGAFMVELWVAVSVRVHQLEQAGRKVDEALLVQEITAALLRTDSAFVRQLAGRTAVGVGRRVGRRWAASLLPVAGMVIDGVGAARTVRLVAALPLGAHPPTEA